MKDEIKEILNYFRKYMSIKDCIKLSKIEDYITNLQKENEQLKKCNRESITFLNQDDIRDILIRKDNKIFELQQRIDKAKEYIKRDDIFVEQENNG